MALGYTIATILKRSSHSFSNDKVCVKIDWLEQLNRSYIQVQGKDRVAVRCVAEQLGLEGSYIPRTYIEQIQLEKLVNEVMALPDDLKTKLSLDEDLISSPKEALSRASADRVALRNKNLKSSMSQSYSNHRNINYSKHTGYADNGRSFDERNSDPCATLASQGLIAQLSEQISSLKERMDEFTNRIEELNSMLTVTKNTPSLQNIALQAESCNGYTPTSYFFSSFGNGSLAGPILPNSSSSSQLVKESFILDEILGISLGQRQVLHQLDSLNSLLKEGLGERPSQVKTRKKMMPSKTVPITLPLILALGVAGLGVLVTKHFLKGP